MIKTGRNTPCPCGSGKKYKRCCIDKINKSMQIPVEVKIAFERMQAQQRQIEKQQGLGRPIVSGLHKDYRFVGVGSELHYSKSWITFHDFLSYYIKNVLGEAWGKTELAKPEFDRHPIMRWMQLTHEHMKAHDVTGKKVRSAPMIGATFALLNLSYNLYLLGHNAEIRDRLLSRLKKKDGFEAALYETFVAAVFINAGFKIDLEDEDDPTSHHSEFIAVAPVTGTKYSVEAKHRRAGKENAAVSNQLYEALKKDLPHQRVVFIDVNVPRLMDQMKTIVQELKDREGNLTIKGVLAPQAYVFVTNHSFAYDLSGSAYERTGFAHGFKIPDFQIDSQFPNLRAALDSRERYADMERLITSMKEHRDIPSTFDGEIPHFAFDDAARSSRLLIGNSYVVTSPEGVPEAGVLETASMIESEKSVYGGLRLQSGKRIICTFRVTDEELAAYREHPDTFFGVQQQVSKKVESPVELYDFFHNSYKRTPKERLLVLMKDWRDLEKMKALSQEDLAKVYCERAVYGAMASTAEKGDQ